MRYIIGCIVLMLAMAIQAQEANYFLLTYYPGASWNEAIPYDKQPGLKTHHEYVRELHVNDLIVMGGGVAEASRNQLSVMLIRTGSLEEAEKLASRDPGVQQRLVRAEVLPWDVTMSSLRFVRRKPIQPFKDPDQSFSIKRVDPESRLNIE
ncbi:MAG: hypothetical protein HOC70_15580 [Gammaproteobacteria bacterium]|jgi:uncharacterized protein YciI|nr:hypothetical protein [Gammaproteobacteria bacterium]MBT4494663.1 hypothetical protein [Gammaproteobacteria bacterium]